MESPSVLYEDKWSHVREQDPSRARPEDSSGEPSLEEQVGTYLEAKQREAGGVARLRRTRAQARPTRHGDRLPLAKDPDTLAELNELMKVRDVRKL
jgi:hypothetical protein